MQTVRERPGKLRRGAEGRGLLQQRVDAAGWVHKSMSALTWAGGRGFETEANKYTRASLVGKSLAAGEKSVQSQKQHIVALWGDSGTEYSGCAASLHCSPGLSAWHHISQPSGAKHGGTWATRA